MFERYTESARRALFFARYEASEFGSLSIETEHLLLGLIRSPGGVLARLLKDVGIAPEALRSALVLRIARRAKIATSVEIPFSAEMRRVLTYAAREADDLRHHDIAPAHLLLGLLREEGSIAGATLIDLGLRLRDARATVAAAAPDQSSPGAHSSELVMDQRDDARRLIERIRQMVHNLAETPAGSPQASELLDRIDHALGSLGRYFA